MIQPDHSDSSAVIVVGYVRRSSEMQKDNYSIDAQKRAIREAAKLRDLPEPIFLRTMSAAHAGSRSPSAPRLSSSSIMSKPIQGK